VQCSRRLSETLCIRRLWLTKLLKRSGYGIIYNDHEAGAIGPRFRQACLMGREGIVSKRRDRTYKGGALQGLDQGKKSPVGPNDPVACFCGSDPCPAQCATHRIKCPKVFDDCTTSDVAYDPLRKSATGSGSGSGRLVVEIVLGVTELSLHVRYGGISGPKFGPLSNRRLSRQDAVS
jgi:hypothetical protein